MMGIPEDQQEFVARRSNTIIGFTDPEYTGITREHLVRYGAPGKRHILSYSTRLMRAGWDLIRMVRELGEERRRDAGDDLISALVSPKRSYSSAATSPRTASSQAGSSMPATR